ncbi:hypothetical protein C7M84_010500 [Penaeus vannamei]|uniref:Uncharacterized protein n=1 Tax=Penaeus vannamei TaxID=6689 RepID=A0A423T4N0_PENVA|nr:hypothetical protein C7M84_010500 [Penaeus vannamei]
METRTCIVLGAAAASILMLALSLFYFNYRRRPERRRRMACVALRTCLVCPAVDGADEPSLRASTRQAFQSPGRERPPSPLPRQGPDPMVEFFRSPPIAQPTRVPSPPQETPPRRRAKGRRRRKAHRRSAHPSPGGSRWWACAQRRPPRAAAAKAPQPKRNVEPTPPPGAPTEERTTTPAGGGRDAPRAERFGKEAAGGGHQREILTPPSPPLSPAGEGHPPCLPPGPSASAPPPTPAISPREMVSLLEQQAAASFPVPWAVGSAVARASTGAGCTRDCASLGGESKNPGASLEKRLAEARTISGRAVTRCRGGVCTRRSLTRTFVTSLEL